MVHRHNDIYAVLVAEARQGCISISIEQKIDKTQTSTYRSDFLLTRGIPGYTQRATQADLVVTCPFNKTSVRAAAKYDLNTALDAEDRKNREQKDDLNALDFDFLPLAFESTGGHTEAVEVLVNYICQQKAIMTNVPFAEHSTRLWQLLSVTLQRANAVALHRRLKESLPVPLED